ncbi:DUF4012 domain-containing protein [Microbacterium sp. Sa4CUA7]|uniref:DUF4012 domain-containing protein n=1 Tax=Microbacterium pullorum TaxID=2762236 RepID=A0ABR8S545_9MICO|nr:DUF4012 domain-containing protein [Microbacterium pullorum]MBD7958597.1 DUF4012 domain-containing protein [Microbacterium pullorum]
MTANAPARRAGSVRVWVWGSVLMLCLLLVALGWLATRVVTAALGLSQVAAAVPALSAAAQADDLAGLGDALDALQTDTQRAAEAVGDPLWGVAETMPLIGADLAAVATVAHSADAVVSQAVTAMDAASSLAASGEGALVDVSALVAAHPPIARAADALTTARGALAAIDATALVLPPVARGVAELQETVSVTEPVIAGLADATAVLPGILGVDAPRTVLVVIQNNAELRSGGGITGSFALLTADGGRVSLVEQADSSEFAHVAAAGVEVPAETTTLYGDVVGRFVQNASMTTDFTLTATLASHWWQERGGVAPDAVLSIDPIVVRALLALTGPVALADGSSLTADNLVQRLLVDPYLTLEPSAQTVFLQSATQAIFQRLSEGGVDAMAWTRALAVPLAEGRVSLWSADPQEQSVLAGTALAGPAARHRTAGDDAFAVYLNDATGGKMGSFLHVDIATGTAHCRTDGRAEVDVTLTMSSSAPADAFPALPLSMTGGGLWGTAWGDIGTNVSVAAPAGWFVGAVRKNDVAEPAVDAVDVGFPTVVAQVNLSPGEVNTLSFRFIAPQPGEVVPTVLHTPMLNEPIVTAGAVVDCR